MTELHAHPDEHAPYGHDLGLAHDLPTLLTRRRALTGLLGSAGLLALAACGGKDAVTPAATATAPAPTATTTTSAAAVAASIPEETGGPFPADGSRGGINVLDDSGIVRSDIRSSFGSSTTTATGVPLVFDLTVLDVAGGGKPLAGAALYLWHCDSTGGYSLYSPDVVDENYLRGVQVADAQGKVRFTSIYPAAYDGRWPHVHFEVFSSVDGAVAGSGKLRTSQLALPEDVSAQVYATPGYEQSVQNLARTSLDSDMVFRDGYSLQLAKVTGDVTTGFTAALSIAV